MPHPAATPAELGTDDELPEGWVAATLPEVFRLNPPKAKGADYRDDLPVTFVPMPAVDALTGTIRAPTVRDFGAVKKGFTSFRDGDVILAKITPCMENGKAAVVGGMLNGLGFGSTEFHVFRPTGAVLAEYLFHFLRQESFRRNAADEMTGSVGQKRVPAEFLAGVELPVPPLAEQRRIVAAVGRVLDKVSSARARLDRVPTTMKRFRQAVLAAACAGRLTADWRAEVGYSGSLDGDELPHLWQVKQLRDVVVGLHQGWSPKCDIEASADGHEWGVIKTTAIQHMQFLECENKRLPPNLIPRRELELIEGDVLITRAGPRVRAGVACLVRKARKRLILCDKAYRFRANSTEIEAEFLELLLNAPALLEKIEAMKTGISDSGVNLTQHKFLALPLPLPPLAEQHEIVRRVSALFAHADAIEARTAAARKRVDALTQAVLAKAFRGELVPTEAESARRDNRPYEPAADLLARLRASAGPVTKVTRGRKPKGSATP